MELTKVGEITAPLSAGEVNISIGTNPKDGNDGYLYFNTEKAPDLIDFKTLLKPKLTELPKLRPLLKDTIKKFGVVDNLAKKLPEEKKYFKAYAEVLGKIGIVKSLEVNKIKGYSGIIKNLTTEGKKFYSDQGLKKDLDKIGVSPTWINYKGHFAGTLVNPICLISDKEAIEKSPLFKEIAHLLVTTNITLMEPVAFLREANWMVKATGISLQSDGGVDFTELVLGMLKTSMADFSKAVKEGDGSAASLAELGINTDELAGAASNHTACGASGNEKVRNACIALGGTPSETTEAEEANSKETTQLEKIVRRLNTAETNYKNAPNPGSLGVWGKIMQKFKALVSQNADDTTLKLAFKDWLTKFNAAKNGDTTTKSETPKVDSKESLVKRLSNLENQIKAQAQHSILEVLELMSACQEIRVNPKFKSVLKNDSDTMGRFKAIRKQLNALIKQDANNLQEMEAMLKDPASIKDKFQLNLDQLWTNFDNTTQKANTFEAILKEYMGEMEDDTKRFQQGVEAQAKGMLEASKMLKLGDEVEISKNMTVIRSGIVKLKNTMATKILEAQKMAQKMADLEYECLFSPDANRRNEIIKQLEQLTKDFTSNNQPVSVF